jgi:hypothetical protein
MRSFHEKIIRTHTARFVRGISRFKGRREQWSKLVGRAEPLMQALAEESKRQNMFEHLFVLNSANISETRKKLPMLQLSFGQHPLGYDEISENKLAAESGCSLTICQLVTGQVSCILYPFCSALHSRREQYIISRVFSSPEKMKARHIKAQMKYLLSYAQVSSAFGSPTILDWLIVYWLKTKHWWIHFRLGTLALNLLSKAAGLALEKSRA